MIAHMAAVVAVAAFVGTFALCVIAEAVVRGWKRGQRS